MGGSSGKGKRMDTGKKLPVGLEDFEEIVTIHSRFDGTTNKAEL